MAYSQLPTRTTSDANASADVNQLQDNIDAILGSEAAAGPADALEDKLNIADLDSAPTSSTTTAVRSAWLNNNIYLAFKPKTRRNIATDYTILDDDGYETIILTDTDNDRTFTLPTASANTHREITVYNNNSYSYNGSNDNDRSLIIESEAAAQTINGVDCSTGGDPIEIEHQYCGLTFKSDGSDWLIIRTIGACEIDMTVTSGIELVYTQYFTGTTDADVQTNIAHGLGDVTKVLHVSAILYEDSTPVYVAGGYKEAASANDAFNLEFNGTDIILADVGANLQGNAYTVKLEFYI